MTREATSQGRRGGIFLASRVFFLAMFAVVALRSTTVLATMESVSGDTAVDRGGDVAHIRGRKLTQQTGPYAPSHWNFIDGTEFRVSTATTPDYIHFTPGGCWKVTNDGYVEGNVPTTPGVTYVVKVELGVVYIRRSGRSIKLALAQDDGGSGVSDVQRIRAGAAQRPLVVRVGRGRDVHGGGEQPQHDPTLRGGRL